MSPIFKCICACSAILLNVQVFVDGACGTVYSSGVDSINRNILVDRHNAIRLLIAQGQYFGQPKASNMKRMKWDSAIAKQAQSLADTCDFNHKIFNDPRFGQEGQNLYMSYAYNKNSPNWVNAVNSWNNENTSYAYPNGFSQKTGHYTQVVWANTYLVGCGYKQFKNPSDKYYSSLYVCNYGPPGNVQGQAPYKKGNGCEDLCS